jgi:hypothetical protein
VIAGEESSYTRSTLPRTNMWSRRSLLAGAGLSLLSVSVAGKLQTGAEGSENGYLERVTVDERPLDVDSDDRRERLIRVRFVPARRLVAVRLEGRVRDATHTDLAAELDSDGDGWYVIARRTGIGHEQRGTVQFLRAPRSRRLPELDDRWFVESRGFQSRSSDTPDFRGFGHGDFLRVVAVPYDDDPVVVTERVVGIE